MKNIGYAAVLWRDAVFYVDETPNDDFSSMLATQESVGYVFLQKEAVLVAHTIDRRRNPATLKDANDFIVIPMSWVVKIVKLNEGRVV